MGRVCFLAIGPGTPGLLTLRGAQRLEHAGAVAFPAGLDPRLLERAPPAAERIPLAPGAGAAHVADRLARAAATHRTVVRLVSGGLLDTEAHAEAALLGRAGVEIEIIPGVPVATAGAALAGEAHGELRRPEARPLFGWTVVVTRTAAQAGDLARLLDERGASVLEVPLIRVEAPVDDAPLRAAIRGLAAFDWVVFTSANGVEWFWTALEHESLDARAFGAARIACIGPGTAAALARRGIRPDLVPDAYVGEALLDALERAGELSGKRILLPRAAGRPVLPDGLRARGAEVVEVEAYRTVPETAGAAALRSWIAADAIDALTFTSPSAVASFADSVGTETGRALVAVIGPVTAEAARTAGLPVHVEATDHTMLGLAEALARRALQERPAGRRV